MPWSNAHPNKKKSQLTHVGEEGALSLPCPRQGECSKGDGQGKAESKAEAGASRQQKPGGKGIRQHAEGGKKKAAI